MWYLTAQIWVIFVPQSPFYWCTLLPIHFYSLQILLMWMARFILHRLKESLNAPPECSGSQGPSTACWNEKALLSAGLKVDSSRWNLWILSLTRIALPLSSCSAPSLVSDRPRSFFWTTFAISATRSAPESAFPVGLCLCTWAASSLSPSSLESSE